MQIKFTLLVDNKPGEGLLEEHGLSMYIETATSRILFDTGQSSKFASNAEKLGKDLKKVDFSVISHGHYDHGGGLPDFFRTNSEAPVYIHSAAVLPVYYSTRRTGRPLYIGIDKETFLNNEKRFTFINSVLSPVSGMHIIPAAEIENRGPIYNDNCLLVKSSEGYNVDTFDHEIFIIFERESDIIVVSGCSHNNILSIIRHSHEMFPHKRLSCVIGGFHLPDRDTPGHQDAVNQTAAELSKYTETRFITGHCTGDTAKLLLKKELGDQIEFFYTGFSFSL